jgi:hypothetical protein
MQKGTRRDCALSQALKIDLQAMRSVDIATVDKAALVDLRDIIIKTALPQRERMIDFIRQAKNPYCFKYKNMAIKSGYEDTEKTMEDTLESYFLSL